MSPDILCIALEQLAKCGYIAVPTRQDADAIAKASPVKTAISKHRGLKYDRRTVYLVQEVKNYDARGT